MRKTLPYLIVPMVIIGSLFYYSPVLIGEKESKREAYEKLINAHKFNQRVDYSEIQKMPKSDRPDLAFQQNYLSTMNPATGRPEEEKIFPILQMTKNMQQSTARTPGSATSPWVERGPNNVGGRTRAIAWDPSSTNKVWAGGATGGLWYNSNITLSSTTWVAVNDFWDNIAVTAIAFDPNNSSIMYVGTGEGWGANSSRGAGVWKSTNGGSSFSQISSTTGFYYVNDLVVRNESGTSVVYVAVAAHYYNGNYHGTSSEGLQRSTNGGSTWSQVLPTISGSAMRASDLDIAADNELWVGVAKNAYGNGGGKIYASTSGTSFSLQYSHSSAGRVNIACAPSNSNYVYAAFEGASQLSAFKQTTNDGSSWSTKSEPNDVDNGIPSTDFTRGQAWYDLTLDVDPNDMNTVIIGGIDLFKTTNGGNAWSQISKWSNNNNLASLNASLVHADQHAIVYKPGSSSVVVFGNDGGVAYSSTANGSTPTILDRNKGYNVTQYYSGAIHPTSGSNYFLAGSQDNGTQKYNSAGMNSTVTATGGDGAFCHIDQTNGNYQSTAYVYNDFYHSSNGGASFNNISLDQSTGKFINPSDLDDNQNIMYTYKTQTSLYKVTGFQSSSPSISTVNISNLFTDASNLKVSPFTTSSTTLFVGTSGGRVFKITNANSSPSSTEITGTSFPTGSVSCIEFGQSENQIIVTFSNYGVTSVWYTGNGGTSWVSKEGNLPDMPIRWALFNPLNVNEVILATEVGVWTSSNFNTSSPTWTASNSGLANVRVDMLQLRSSDNEVIASTFGRGLFSCDGFSGGGSNPAYCAATSSSNPCDEYISNVTIGSINSSTTCGNYSDYSALSTSVNAGASVAMSISTAQVNGSNAGYTSDQVAVWVDWNNDLDFTDTGEDVYLVTYGSTTTFPLSFNITVPSGLTTGNVRMRVRMSYFPDDGQITPCGTSIWGEVEDYTLAVVGANPTYCTATSTSNPCDEYISNVSIGSVNNSSTCGNYMDYTGQVANVGIGASVPMTITTGIVGGTNAGYTDDQVAVWVDWNNDNDFTDSGENEYVVTFGASTSFPLSFNLTVPNNVSVGTVRMRVRMSYLPADGQITPCGTSAWGEVEDYTLNIQQSTQITWTNQPGNITIECDAPTTTAATGLATASTTCTTGSLPISYSDNSVNGSCANASVLTRTWLAADGCGNTETFDQIITIRDNTSPTITCPATQELLSTNGSNATMIDYTGMATASDNCSSVANITISQVPAVGTVLNLGNTNVTVTATDECGNSDNCTFILDVKFTNGIETFTVNDIQVYPNPSNGIFNLDLGALQNELITISVLDVLGEVVLEKQQVEGQQIQKIDLTEFTTGVYLIEIKTENTSLIKRVMKQ